MSLKETYWGECESYILIEVALSMTTPIYSRGTTHNKHKHIDFIKLTSKLLFGHENRTSIVEKHVGRTLSSRNSVENINYFKMLRNISFPSTI